MDNLKLDKSLYYSADSNSLKVDYSEIINQYVDRYKDIDIKGEYFLKRVDDNIDKTGWIILNEFINTDIAPITLESIPDAWGGVKFRISVIHTRTSNFIFGSPELIDYHIDRDYLISIVKDLIDKSSPIGNGVFDLKLLDSNSINSMYYQPNFKIDNKNGICSCK